MALACRRAARLSESRRRAPAHVLCVRAVSRGPRGCVGRARAAVAAELGRAAAWRSRARRQHISNSVRFWPKPRAERPRAARQAVGVELWTLSTCGGAVIAAMLSLARRQAAGGLTFKL